MSRPPTPPEEPLLALSALGAGDDSLGSSKRPRVGGFLVGTTASAKAPAAGGSGFVVSDERQQGADEGDLVLLTTAETLAEGRVYLNEHPRRRGNGNTAAPAGAPLSVTDIVAGKVPSPRGAFLSGKPSAHNGEQQRLARAAEREGGAPALASSARSGATAAHRGGSLARTYNSTTANGQNNGSVRMQQVNMPRGLLPAAGVARPEDAEAVPPPSQIVFGSDDTAEAARTAPILSHSYYGGGAPSASVSCNIDHDDNLVRKIVVAYAERQLLASQRRGNTNNNKGGATETKRGGGSNATSTTALSTINEAAVDDLFMRSVMSVSKLPSDVLGPAASSAGGGFPFSPSLSTARNCPSVIAPTKIPIQHWVLRETLYDGGSRKSGNNKKQKEDASVFNDLRQNKRSVVFPSNAPNNRPEVYYLAQTLDIMFAAIPKGFATLASGEECYRILEPALPQQKGDDERGEPISPSSASDPTVESSLPLAPAAAFPPASARYYDAALALWDVLDAGFTEVSRQLSPQCSERAALLEALRTVAKDVGTTGLEVMQFCKEEVRSLLQREAELEAAVAERDARIAALEAEVAMLRAREGDVAADLASYEELKARYDAVRRQVHIGTAMLVRDRRLADVLAAMDAANSSSYASPPQNSEVEKSSIKKGASSSPSSSKGSAAMIEGIETNPHLALLASGVSGIDIEAVKRLVRELDDEDRRRDEEEGEGGGGGATGGKRRRRQSRASAVGENNNETGEGPTSPTSPTSSPDSSSGAPPETYSEAIKYLLTLDEAVRAIDTACLPFYQRALFANPALCVSVASGKWRGIAKAIGRHEMILEQRERQWREAVRQIRREEAAAAGEDGTAGNSISAAGASTMFSPLASFRRERGPAAAGGLASAAATNASSLPTADHSSSSPLEEGTVIERQMAFMQQFRASTRRLLGAAFGIGGAAANSQNLDGFGEDDRAPGDDNDDPSAADGGGRRRRQRGDDGQLVIGSKGVDPAAKANAEAFLNAKLMLPAPYTMGRSGIAAMLKDTRAVMVEIVQRLCALATSAQLRELTRPPMLPPSEPNEPCPLCSRLHVAEMQRRRRDEAMARLVEDSEQKEKAFHVEVAKLRGELEDANARIARSLRQAKDAQSRANAVERQMNQQGKALQQLKDWGGASTNSRSGLGLSGGGGRGDDDSDDVFAYTSSRGSISNSKGSRRQREPSAAEELGEEEEIVGATSTNTNGEDEEEAMESAHSSPMTRRARGGGLRGSPGRRRKAGGDATSSTSSPIVVELVINCSCCGGGANGGGGSAADQQRNALLLRSQQLSTTSAAAASGSEPKGGGPRGTALTRLMASYAGVGAAAAAGGAVGASSVASSLSRAPSSAAVGGAPPTNAAELLEALARGDVAGAMAGRGSAAKGSLFHTPAPPGAVGAVGAAGGSAAFLRNTVSLRQTQAALGIKKKQPTSSGAASVAGASSSTSPLFDGVDDGGAVGSGGVGPHASPSAASKGHTAAGASAAVSSTDPIVEGVSDLMLYDAKAEERARRRLKESQQDKSREFWGYIGRVIGAGGDMGGRRDGDPPEVFPTNPQYANIRSKLGVGTSKGANPHRYGYAPLLAGGHDPSKAGLYYPPPPSRGAAAVIRNLLTEEEGVQSLSNLRPALGLPAQPLGIGLVGASSSSAASRSASGYGGSYSGGGRAPKSLGWLLKFVTHFYKSKLFADLVTMHHRPRIARDGSGLQRPIAYLSELLRHMYGHASVVRGTLEDVALACASYHTVDPRVAQFVRFLTDESTLPQPASSTSEGATANGMSSASDGEGGGGEDGAKKAPVSEASRSLFFFSRLSRAVDNCTVGLSYATSNAAFSHDEDQTRLQIVSLARLQGVLQQTQLIKKPYAAALWDVVCAGATVETVESFRSAQARNGFTLLQTELHPKDWAEDDVKRARMTCPKIVFLVAATQFEAILREQLVAEPAASSTSGGAGAVEEAEELPTTLADAPI